jgi:hypothetical protein
MVPLWVVGVLTEGSEDMETSMSWSRSRSRSRCMVMEREGFDQWPEDLLRFLGMSGWLSCVGLKSVLGAKSMERERKCVR